MIISQAEQNRQTLDIAQKKSLDPHKEITPARGLTEPLRVLTNGSVQWVAFPPNGNELAIQVEKNILCGSRYESHTKTEFQNRVSEVIHHWPTTKLKGMVGIINQLTWHWSNCWGAVKTIDEADADGNVKSKPYDCDRDIVQEALATPALLNTSVTSTVNYVKRFWASSVGASCSRATVKRYTAELKELGLLDYDSQFQSVGRARNRFYTYLDIPHLLLLAELIMERLQAACPDAMPSHWGQFMGWLYDAVFPTGWGWRKKGNPDDVEPETVRDSLMARVWASHLARVELSEREPWRGTFRSAVRHLRQVVELDNLIGGCMGIVTAARGLALAHCRNTHAHDAIARVCPMLVTPS